MTDRRLTLCADVGGTFTDCLAAWQDSEGRSHRGSLKVLSTGLIRCLAVEVIDAQTLRVEVPEELVGNLPGGRLPDDFFRTARLDQLCDGIRKPLGEITEFRSHDSQVTFRDPHQSSTQGILGGDVSAGDLVEIDCRLEAPVLAARLLLGIPIDQPLPQSRARLGTTRGTNALLTRTGAPTALVATQGFGDVLMIGEQNRSELFDLAFAKSPPLAEYIVEIRARLDAQGNELVGIDEAEVRSSLQAIRRSGAVTLAICLLHAHQNPAHEIAVERIARSVGFQEVSRSSEVAPLIKLISRAETTTLDAYLAPVLSTYVRRIRSQFGGEACELELMTSGGNLVAAEEFRGRDSVLSGPAGGVVGLQAVAEQHGCPLAIGLDMGGTSTDVSRFDGQVGRRYETQIADIRVMTPMMDIHTVAAGGGSICDFLGGRLVVGPGSAGASPGPACYGSGGPLTITDVNLLLGRICEDRFPFPLSPDASRERLQTVASRMPEPPFSTQQLAEGFLEIAVTHMAEAVRAITTARGVDVRDHALVGFGGAAAQHICRVADALGISKIIDHPKASVLSAVGMGVASKGHIETSGVYREAGGMSDDDLRSILEQTRTRAIEGRAIEGRAFGGADTGSPQPTRVRWECDCRYVGTDAKIELPIDSQANATIEAVLAGFHDQHRLRFGYARPERSVELVSVRCEVVASDPKYADIFFAADSTQSGGDPRSDATSTEVYCKGAFQSFARFARESLVVGDVIPPASLVVSDQSTLVVEPNWQGRVADDGSIVLVPDEADSTASLESVSETDEAVRMEIVARRLQSIADSMGEVLRRTAISVNVKERLDFSCAVFRGDGSLIANAPHVPVHLGAMGHTVRSIAREFDRMSDGDCYVSNDPYAGGSHLPDVTVVTPVFCDSVGATAESSRPDFFVASRAHHAEIGGRTPGSMPPMAKSLAEEGVLIRAFALVRNGVSHEDDLRKLLAGGPYPSRNVDENLADLRAQIAAGREGARAIRQMTSELSFDVVEQMMGRLLDVAEQSVLRWIESLPQKPMRFRDVLDDGTEIAVSIARDHGRLVIDFDGTGGVHPGAFNATESIVNSAVLYVMRCFCDANLPLCDGAMRPIDLKIPAGLLSPPPDPDPGQCAAVVAGNVETSQRIVDVLLGAIGSTDSTEPVFRTVAASQGTMNNVLVGDASFGYYETIGGGAGATVFGAGADGVHTHMTNTRITDAEVLETRLPIRLREFSLRRGSGGAGRHRGGDGLIREFEFLRPMTVSLITGRRTTAPYGAYGGQPGKPGRNLLIRDGEPVTPLPPATTIQVRAGDRLRLETPGGGGWGKPAESQESPAEPSQSPLESADRE